AAHLETLERLRQVAAGTGGVRTHLEVVPADVRQHRYCNRQRARRPLGTARSRACQVRAQAVRRSADARLASAGLVEARPGAPICTLDAGGPVANSESGGKTEGGERVPAPRH